MTTAPFDSIATSPSTPNHVVGSSTAGEWIQMNPRDISSSVYNEKPLTEETRKLKIRNIQHAINTNNLEAAQTLAMSREGLLKKSYRKILCKYNYHERKISYMLYFLKLAPTNRYYIFV